MATKYFSARGSSGPALRATEAPTSKGEYFGVRFDGAIGLDMTPGCFVCGEGVDSKNYHKNISGFVTSKESGERVVGMFEHGARLDYREREPNWIQVKIGSCDTHAENLSNMAQLIMIGRRITPEIVAQAKAYEGIQ